MLIIRWLATEIRIFAYVQNTILVVCFLGIGLGCFTSRAKVDFNQTLFPLFLVTVLLGAPPLRFCVHAIAVLLSALKDLRVFEHMVTTDSTTIIVSVVIGLLASYLVLKLILDMFVPIGRLLGRLLDEHENTLWAYSVNVAGSLVGTWLFVLLSAWHAPPVVWCVVVVLLTLYFIVNTGTSRPIAAILCCGIIGFSWWSGMDARAVEIAWSPYQKLVLQESDPKAGEVGKYQLMVNNIRFQDLVDLTASNTHLTGREAEMTMPGYGQYDLPLLLHPNPQKMLIVGAGSGNDVAGGLMHGVKDITAVEIDPIIVDFGRRYHPQKPYSSPSVRVVIDDARSFFATCQEKFDVVSFALLDSHTSSALSTTRLDEYVFTRESIERAKSLLAPGGIITLHSSNIDYELSDRLAHALFDLFKEKPFMLCTFGVKTGFGYGGLLFVAGNLAGVRDQIVKDPALKAAIEKWQKLLPPDFPCTTPTTTDDWPFFYLKTRTIPILYFLLGGVILILFFRSCKALNISFEIFHWDRSSWHFFFLGAAFMLLEVQNISKAAVVLGSTWTVNAVIVSGVLLMILLANLLAAKFPRIPLLPVYGVLWASCLLFFFIDLASFAFLPWATKALVAGCLTTLPMAFSGIIFIRSFAATGAKDRALGANLFGSLLGGLTQCVTFLIGIKALLLAVAGLYALSWAFMPPALVEEAAAKRV